MDTTTAIVIIVLALVVLGIVAVFIFRDQLRMGIKGGGAEFNMDGTRKGGTARGRNLQAGRNVTIATSEGGQADGDRIRARGSIGIHSGQVPVAPEEDEKKDQPPKA